MKKTFRILALAFVAMTVAVACNGNAESADTIDTMPIDTPAIEAPIEDTVIDTPVVEQPTATTKKPAKTQKASTPDASKVTLSDSKTGTTIKMNGKGVKVNSNEGEAKVDASGVKLSTSNGATMKLKTN